MAIDVGITRTEKNKLCGDISEAVKETCYLATPVPGGVGPLTVVMLMKNTLSLWQRQMQILR